MVTRIMVCRTCPRYAPNPHDEETMGAALGAEIIALAAAQGWDPGNVRIVNCLAGCKNPCNVALEGSGKLRLRFSLLETNAGQAVLDAAAMHAKSESGDIADELLPEVLQGRLSAKSPPRIGD